MTQDHKGERVTPTNILKLVSSVGVTRAARAIGVSTTTVQTARKKNIATKVVETSAAGVLSNMAAHDIVPPTPHKLSTSAVEAAPATVIVLLEVEKDRLPLVEKFARAIAAELIAA